MYNIYNIHVTYAYRIATRNVSKVFVSIRFLLNYIATCIHYKFKYMEYSIIFASLQLEGT